MVGELVSQILTEMQEAESKLKTSAGEAYIEEVYKEIDYKNKDKIATVKAILNKTFGEENNSITKNEDVIRANSMHKALSPVVKTNIQNAIKSVAYYITIRFPHITIRNSNKKTHEIYDLFVRFTLRADFGFYSGMNGVRSTYTEVEYLHGYGHSHLSGGSSTAFSGFCLGNGPIGQTLLLLGSDFTAPKFQMLCLHLKNYVQWESLEGVPHFRMDQIGSSILATGNAFSGSGYEHFFINFTKKVLEQLDGETLEDMVRLTLNRTSVVVEPKDEFERYLGKFIEEKREEMRENGRDGFYDIADYIESNYALTIKKSDGTYYQVTSNRTRSVPEKETEVLVFKGEKIFLKIINQGNESIKSGNYAHPNITAGVCGVLSKEVGKVAFQYKYNNKEEDSAGDKSDTPKSDIFSL